jgi:hypothetical protein
MPKQIKFYEAFASINPFTGQLEKWMGTAPLATIRKHRLFADLSYPLYADDSLCGPDGWACKAPGR